MAAKAVNKQRETLLVLLWYFWKFSSLGIVKLYWSTVVHHVGLEDNGIRQTCNILLIKPGLDRKTGPLLIPWTNRSELKDVWTMSITTYVRGCCCFNTSYKHMDFFTCLMDDWRGVIHQQHEARGNGYIHIRYILFLMKQYKTNSKFNNCQIWRVRQSTN